MQARLCLADSQSLHLCGTVCGHLLHIGIQNIHCLHDLEQAYMEISKWAAPAVDARDVLALGNVKMTVQVPAFATLPPPAPEESVDPLAPLPILLQPGGLETIRGAFFEVHLARCPQWQAHRGSLST